MQFIKTGDVYKVARITGAQDNLLGITLADSKSEIEITPLEAAGAKTVRTAPEEVLRQVANGLASINLKLNKNYYISKIFYLPHESAANSVYEFLVSELIEKIDGGEVS